MSPLARAARPAVLLVALLLGACATLPERQADEAAAPPANAVTVDVPPSTATARAEALAARCWLDGRLGGNAVMLVDRRGGRILLQDDAETLIALGFEALPAGRTAVALSGRLSEDAATAASLRRDIAGAVGAGATVC